MFTNTEDVSFNETDELPLFRIEYKCEWGVEASLKLNKEGEFVETKELEDYLHKFKVNK